MYRREKYRAALPMRDDVKIQKGAWYCLEGEALVAVGHHLRAVDRALDGAVGLLAHDIGRDAAGIGAELSHGPRDVVLVHHDLVVEEGRDRREAEARDRAERLVVGDVAALGHEDEVDLVADLALREAGDDARVDLDWVVGAAGEHDGEGLDHDFAFVAAIEGEGAVDD